MATVHEASEKTVIQDALILQTLRKQLNVSLEELPSEVEQLLLQRKALEKEIQHLKQGSLLSMADSLLEQQKMIVGVPVIIQELAVENMNQLRQLADHLKQRLQPCILLLALRNQEKASLLCMVSEELIQKNAHAGSLLQEMAKLADGRGGGKPQMAQAGAKSPEKLPHALEQAPSLIQQHLESLNLS